MEKLLSREELKLIYPKIKVIIFEVKHIHSTQHTHTHSQFAHDVASVCEKLRMNSME